MELITPTARTGTDAYKAIHSRVIETMQWREQRKFGDKQWRLADRLVLGKVWPTRDEEDQDGISAEQPSDRINVNIIASSIQDYLPFLVRQSPKYILKPRPKSNAQDVIQRAIEQAKNATYVLNYYFNRFGMNEVYKAAVDDGLTYGHGIVKTGWALELAGATNEQKHGKIEMDTKIVLDNPTLSRVDPYKFYFDRTASDCTLRTASWAAEMIYMPAADIVANQQFSKKVRSKIVSGAYTLTTVSSHLSDKASEKELLTNADVTGAESLGVLFEYWDKRFEKYYVFAVGIDEPLIEEETAKFPYLPEFFPYAKWDFMRRNSEPYGYGIPYMAHDQQFELARVRTSEYDHRRKYSKTKWIIAHNGMDADQIRKLTSDRDEVCVANGPPDQVIRPFNPPPISSDNYRVDAIIQEDVRRMLGLDQLMSGGNLPSRTSAREIDARQSLIGTKLQGRVESVDIFAEQIGRQIFKHIQENLSTDMVAEIAGDEGAALWEDVSPGDIQGEYDFELISSSKVDFDPIQERQQRTQLLQILVNQVETLAMQGMMVNVPEVLKWVLDSYERPETGSFIMQIPAPPQQEAAPQGEQVSTETQDAGQRLNAQQGGAASELGGAALGGGL